MRTLFPVALLALLSLASAPARAQEACDPTREDCGPDAPRTSMENPIVATPPIAEPYPDSPILQPYPGWGVPPQQPAWYPQEVRTHVEVRRRTGLGAAGIATFGGLWLFTSAGGFVSGEGRLAIPVFGPVAYLAKYREKFDCKSADPETVIYCPTEGSSDRMLGFILVVDTILQAGGLAMAAAGFMTKRNVTVRDTPRYSIVPSVGPGRGGLVAVGTF
ncbi:MAG: hypothetical protein EXR72_11625 [Myxococcales bacterium]|nr:hypothetical protein [Myxococcales bacterium]